MDRKQVALILAANALISTLISLIVALGLVLLLREGGVATPAPQPTLPASVATEAVGAGLTPAPTATPIVHVVQPGDTLSGLSLRYDVPAADIIAANQIQNPNFLQIGAELIIPVGGVPPMTPTLTPLPTATDTPIPFQPPSADMTATAAAQAGATLTPFATPPAATGETQIAIARIVGAGLVDQEGVVLTNRGTGRADLRGWTLSDGKGNVYTFPNFVLWPGGEVTVYTRAGQDGSPLTCLYWGKLQAVWSLGATVTLRDAAGRVVATYTVQP